MTRALSVAIVGASKRPTAYSSINKVWAAGLARLGVDVRLVASIRELAGSFNRIIHHDYQDPFGDLRRPAAACYHCLFAEDARSEEERCATMGVFVPLVGVVGTLQAAEAIKVLAGMGESLDGRLLMFDALAARWHEVRFVRDPLCRVCGDAHAAAAD